MNKSIFDLLLLRAEQEGVVIQNADKSRFIAKIAEADSLLLSDAELNPLLLGRRSRLVQVKHGTELYFCLFGVSGLELLPEGMENIPLTPALFTCAVLEGKVLPIATGSEIKDAIESDFRGVMGYGGHDVTVIATLFPTVLVYKGNSDYEYQHNIQRVMGSFLVRALDDLQIELEEATVNSLVGFFEAGSHHIPFEILLRGIMSVTWEGLFLDAYRCIEQIYSCIKVSSLRSDWASGRPLRELAELLESHLAWRPKEDDALASILERCDPVVIKDACSLLNVPLDETVMANGQEVVRVRTDEKLARSVAKNIYAIRNNLVHYRPVHELVKKSDGEWNAIVRLMLKLVRESYELFGPSFFENNINISVSAHLEARVI